MPAGGGADRRRGLQIVRAWVVRFNAGGPGWLVGEAPGQTPRLTAAPRAALARAAEAGPKPYLDGVVRWWLGDLAAWLREELGVCQRDDGEPGAGAAGLPGADGAAAGARAGPRGDGDA